MKNTLIIYTHPNPRSFNHALLESAAATLREAGAEVKVKDLYQERFNPILAPADFESFRAGRTPPDIAHEQALVQWADYLIFIYPMWWFDRPAMLKGWIDRVFSNGFAFRYGPNGAEGLLKHKGALVLQTIGAGEETYLEMNALDAIERPMRDGTLRYSGIANTRMHNFFSVPMALPEVRAAYLQDAARLTRELLSS